MVKFRKLAGFMALAWGMTGLVVLAWVVGCAGRANGPQNSSIEDYPPIPCPYEEVTGPVFYVDTDGSDDSGDGSETDPWATISHAVQEIPDGSTVLVQPGTYTGRVSLRRDFQRGVIVRSAVPYQAKLRGKNDRALICYGCEGITVEGFDIAHDGPSSKALVIQMQSMGPDDPARYVSFRNNILHNSYNNDILKINNGATDVLVERNIFYNQQGSDEHIDINSVRDVIVQDNVFFNDFSASGRKNNGDTGSYIVIKDSNGGEDGITGSRRVAVRRNIFLNWQGKNSKNFVLIGEDGASYIEGIDIEIENNLMLGNSNQRMRAPFGIKSGKNIMFRNNTLVGDGPANEFAMRVNVENPRVRNENISFFNNIWADPTGTMSRFSAAPIGETKSFTLDTNLYWNNGDDIPHNDNAMINMSDDDNAVVADPALGNQRGLVTPVWDASRQRFADGSATVCGVFQRLVERYGTPAADSAVVDAARADAAPDHDILGNARDSAPDIGAVELQ